MNKWYASNIVAFVLSLLILSQLVIMAVLYTNADSDDTVDVHYTFVIDAGHGGIDGGVVGSAGTKESSINLLYAMELGEMLSNRGFDVVQTRKTADGLYGLPTSGFKRRDMERREQIVQDANADIVVSIHMNKYSDPSRSGPQVFYQEGDTDSKVLADSVQSSFNHLTGNTHSALSGDYYICRCVDQPSIIVECGFLSNPHEEQLLNTDQYRAELLTSLMYGIMMYLYSL